MNLEPLYTKRLALIPISVAELIALAEDPEALYLYRLRVGYVRENPENNKWLFRRITLKQTGEQIGLISFHAPPDDRGMIEVGFGIDVEYQNQGYGTEALAAMFDFAAREPEVKVLRYTVSASNIPSMIVIAKFGFRHVGQQIDEEDGPEEIFEISAKEYLAKS